MTSVKPNGKDQSKSGGITPSDTDAVNETEAVKCGPSSYKEGERVIARHGIEFYRAKIERIEFRDDWRYRIHYIGWKKRWDEWVGVDRLVKFTDENSRMLSRDTKHVAHKFAKFKKPFDTQLYVANQKKQTDCKRKWEDFEVKEENGVQGKQLKMSIPSSLKKRLMVDFEFINKMDELVKLPRVPSVDDILDKYHNCRRKEDVVSAAVGEVVSGVRVYFNKALPVILLYNKERQQYQEAIGERNVSPSRVYGAEHLLRLFVKLPNLLSNLSIDKQTRRELQQNLHDILRFIQKNQSLFFLSTYYQPDPFGKTALKGDRVDG